MNRPNFIRSKNAGTLILVAKSSTVAEQVKLGDIHSLLREHL